MIAPGNRVGRFVIHAHIGRGGMGDVYRATDSELARDVAVKVLHTDDQSQVTTVRTRLLREARAGASFAHPNAVVIYDIGETDDGLAYIAMELVEGDNLRRWIGDTGVPVLRRVGWLIEVARALAAAHARGLIHRDVKPENVMIGADGVVKVLDFGLARQIAIDNSQTTTELREQSTVSSIRTASRMAGTPRYMSPEQLRGESIDHRSDQFSWAVMAYELLTGELPWRSTRDPLQLAAAILTEEPLPIERSEPAVPPNVARAVHRALAKSISSRFASMDELVGAVGTARSTRIRRRAVVAAAVLAGGFVLVRWSGGSQTEGDGGVCASHSACLAAMQQPARCVPDRGCVALTTDACRVFAESADLIDNRTVFVGAVIPLGADWAQPELHALELARRDFATLMRGFRETGARPLALVACDESGGTQKALSHLVDDLRVPAVIGFSNGAELIELAGAKLGPRGVLAIAPFTTSPLLATLPRLPDAPRLVFRTTYDSGLTARALAAAIPAIFEPGIRADLAPEARERMLRVVLVHQRAPRLSAFAGMFFNALHFNGRSALANGDHYRELTYDENALDSPTAGFGPVRDALVELAPDVVVVVGAEPISERLVIATDQAWRNRDHRPRWLALGAVTAPLLRYIGDDALRRHRFFGISEVTTAPANARFVLHYNEVFADKIRRAGSPNTSYDAFYLFAYATYAVGDDAVTGRSLAHAIARLLPPGRRIEVGPAAIFDGFSALRRGENIDLDGAAGSLNFDLESGDAPIDQALLCVAVDPAGHAVGSTESGIVYDATKRTLRGTLACP